MPSDEFVSMITNENILGNPLVKTQHFLGEAKYWRTGTDSFAGEHQIRAAHQRYQPDGKGVAGRSHSHGSIRHFYTRVDGQWKFGGLEIVGSWYEHHQEKVFHFMKD